MSYHSTRLTQAGQYHKTGDLVFSRDNGLLSRVLRIGQERLDGVPATYSHVAICIYPGLLLHSVPQGGVQFLKLEEPHREQITFSAGRADVVVLRPCYAERPTLSAIQAMLFWTGQRYNFSFLRPVESLSGRAYCSQLIVQILSRLEALPDSEFGNARVTPSALFRWAVNQGAADVTDRYVAYAERLASDRQEREHLRRDAPRELIIRAAAHNIRQATIKKAITDTTAAITIGNSALLQEVAAGLRSLRGAKRPLRESLQEAADHLYGLKVALDLMLHAHPPTTLHYLEVRRVPLPVLSGIHLSGSQIAVVTREVAALADEAAWLGRTIDEEGGEASLVAHIRVVLAGIADAPHTMFRAQRDTLRSVLARIPAGERDIEGLRDLVNALCTEYQAVIDLYNALLLKVDAIDRGD